MSFLVTIAKIVRAVDSGATVASKAKPYLPSRSSWQKTRGKLRLAAKFYNFAYNRGRNKGYRQGIHEACQQERLVITKRLLKLGVDPDTVCRATKVNRKQVASLL